MCHSYRVIPPSVTGVLRRTCLCWKVLHEVTRQLRLIQFLECTDMKYILVLSRSIVNRRCICILKSVQAGRGLSSRKLAYNFRRMLRAMKMGTITKIAVRELTFTIIWKKLSLILKSRPLHHLHRCSILNMTMKKPKLMSMCLT